ncbi:hypothetical protein PMZ80_010921 [Knufia obscura]|uniref:Uncharacterized protein n=2 Tax=Knufia TaxID=430999 RepID=A0AAN8EDI0_9EURO|nr:hypothetical protein PMZ80_010921 [Knufia obscura]KAK5948878.1 hypothetical protein OHC33_010129 [Knufia fluminis]
MASETRLAAHRGQSTFLRCPSEVRLIIYDFLFLDANLQEFQTMFEPDTRILLFYRQSTTSGWSIRDENLLAILQTCRTIREEALPVLSKHLHMYVDGTGGKKKVLPLTSMLFQYVHSLEWDKIWDFDLELEDVLRSKVWIWTIGVFQKIDATKKPF